MKSDSRPSRRRKRGYDFTPPCARTTPVGPLRLLRFDELSARMAAKGVFTKDTSPAPPPVPTDRSTPA